jgi:signal transduction histidine kinase
MTADSLLPRTADLGSRPKPAVDARLFSDLLGEVSGHAPEVNGHAPKPTRRGSARIELDAVERAFGRHFYDERARAGVEAARARALRLATPDGQASESVALACAGDLFVSLAVERTWRSRDAGDVVTRLASLFGADPDSLALELFVGAVRAPQLLELPPLVALEVQLSMLLALTPVVEASLWLRDSTGRPSCMIAIGRTATTRRFRATALRALDGTGADSGERGMIIGVPVRRWQSPWAALVARVGTRSTADVALEEAGAAMSPVMERDFLLERSAAREHSLVNASEKRLGRLGFDLHDGALQHVAALGAEIRSIRRGVCETLPEPIRSSSVSRMDEVDNRVRELDRVLRELAHSLEPASLLRRPLPRVIESEAAGLTERTGIEVDTHIVGDFGGMTASQKIALIRVVQEALTNIREHSNAANVSITIVAARGRVDAQIEDDGDGFDVTRTLLDAAQRGRLGLVGSSERVRLLGGTFDIRSRGGGPTRVSLSLPRWQPLAVEQADDAAALSGLVVG